MNSEIFKRTIYIDIYSLHYTMKVIPILLLAILGLSFTVIAPLSIGSSYALKDEDGRWV